MCEVNKCIKSIVISSTVDCYSEDVAPLAISSFFFYLFFLSALRVFVISPTQIIDCTPFSPRYIYLCLNVCVCFNHLPPCAFTVQME